MQAAFITPIPLQAAPWRPLASRYPEFRVQYRVLGPLEAVSNNGESAALGGMKQRTVLACLLLHHNEIVSTDALIDATWSEDDVPASPRSALQTYVSRLRKQLGDGAIGARQSGYVLRVGPDDLDASVFERLALEGKRAAEAGQHTQAVERLDAALAMWGGEPYAEFTYLDFARGEAERLHELRRSVEEDRLQALLDLQRHREVIPALDKALELHPLRERLWVLYMTALYRDGRQADALEAYRRAASALGEQLGVEPGPDLREVEEKILLHDPELLHPAAMRSGGLPEGEITFVVATADDTGLAPDEDVWSDFDQQVDRHRGTVVPAMPHIRLAVFEHTTIALTAATEIQRIARQSLALAIHATEAFVRRGEYVGPGVSRATRVATAAGAGQILLTDAAARMVSPLDAPASLERADLDLPGMSTAETVYALRHPDLDTHAKVAPAAQRTNLQAGGLTSFIGRSMEMREIRNLTNQHRLVTLVGPGGVGKTRLGYQVAADLVGRFQGGVWLIELAALEPELMMPTVLSTLGIETFPEEEPVEAVARHAVNNPIFLVFDNCEHVIDEAAATVRRLLQSSDEVHVLATSRERLGVPGEIVYQVSGLATPAVDDALDFEDVAANDAVALFLERAQGVRSDFSLDASLAPAVATVCRRLDGIPLALELAASRLDVLSPKEIAARLDDRFRLLVTRDRGIPARQRTLEAVLDWSYDLLDQAEQVLLRRLAPFRGAFDLQAAENVCARDDLQSADVLDALGGLVAKNLVMSRVEHGTTRYSLLETVGVYARRLAEQHGETEEAYERHADHYRQLAADWFANEPPITNEFWEPLVAQLDNVRAMLEWLVHHRPSQDLLSAVGHLQWFWLFRSMTQEGLMWTRRTLGSDAAVGSARFQLLRGGGPLAAEERQYKDAERWTRESLEHWQSLGDSGEAATDLNNLGFIAQMQGQLVEALRLIESSIENLEKDSQPSVATQHKLSGSHITRAETLCDLGRLEEAEQSARRALDIERAIETDAYLCHESLRSLGRIALSTGDAANATDWYTQAKDVGSSLGADFTVRSLNGLASVALSKEDLQAAEQLLRQAVDLVDSPTADRLESMRLLSLTHLVSGRVEQARATSGDMLVNSAGGGGERLLAGALEAVGLAECAGGDSALGAKLLASAWAARRSAGLVSPNWARQVLERIAVRYGFSLTDLESVNEEAPLSTSAAGRLALGVR